MEKLKFRNLRADEIEARVARASAAGVTILLYKDARCDMNILDETVGPMNWQRHHSRDNANCTVAIRDANGNWIEKEDTGMESDSYKEKGLASDSFKRACFNWGIGRELYTAPRIFIPAANLKKLKETTVDGKQYYNCYDSFSVYKIVYYEGETPGESEQKKIKSLTLLVSDYGKPHTFVYFKADGTMQVKEYSPETAEMLLAPTKKEARGRKPKVTESVPEKEQALPEQTSPEQTPPEQASSEQSAPKQPASAKEQTTATNVQSVVGPFADTQVINIGNLNGKTWGEIRKSASLYAQFLKLAKWTKGCNESRYDNPAQQEVFLKIKNYEFPAFEQVSA